MYAQAWHRKQQHTCLGESKFLLFYCNVIVINNWSAEISTTQFRIWKGYTESSRAQTLTYKVLVQLVSKHSPFSRRFMSKHIDGNEDIRLQSSGYSISPVSTATPHIQSISIDLLGVWVSSVRVWMFGLQWV